jgi:hypothetical protein
MSVLVSNRLPPPLCGSLASAAIGAIMAFSLANYAYHYALLPESIRHSTLGYFLTVQLPFGVVLPSVVLGLRVRKPSTSLSDIGVWLDSRDLIGGLAGLAAGGSMVILAIGTRSITTQGVARVGVLFAQLLVASVVEVLVFAGLLLGLARCWCRRLGRWALVGAIPIASLGFGVFHFTYPPPWATWGFALGLSAVWIAVTAALVLTRTLLAAIIFNNCMAVIGFLQNDLTLPSGVLSSLTMWFVALGVALGLVIVVSRDRGEAAVQHAATAGERRGT